MNCLFVIVLLFMFGCQEETPFPIIDMGSTNQDSLELDYELLWEVPLRKDSIFDYGIRMEIQGNEIYYSRTPEGLPELPQIEEMVCLDKQSGQELWSWYNENNRTFTQPVINEEQIAFENRNHYYILNRFTGEELFQGYEAEGDLETLIESGLNSLVANIAYGDPPSQIKNKVIEINRQTGILDTILVREKDDDFNHYISFPQFLNNVNGDKILLYFYTRIIWHPGQYHLDFIKYNLTQDSIEWIVSDFAHTNSPSTRTPPIILDDKVYAHTTRSAFCFDLETGEEIWRVENTHTNFIFTNVIINDNILNTVSDEGHLIGIDINTGEELYDNDYGSLAMGVTYHKGRIYYASEDIFIVDHKTGELLHKIASKNENGQFFFRNKIAIDEENDVMFAQDAFSIQAIKIPN